MKPVNLCNGLASLVEALRTSQTLNRKLIEELLRSTDISLVDVEAFLHSSNDHYTRNLVYGNENFQVLVLCWMPAQGSPVHGHGISACGMKVIAGSATESSYLSLADSEPSGIQILKPTEVVASDGGYVHKVENAGPELLITLHVYSPPLVVVAQ